MPSTGMLIGSTAAGSTVWFMAESLVPPPCGPSHHGKVKALGRKFHSGTSDYRFHMRPWARHDTNHDTIRERAMRKIIVGEFTSLDGGMPAPGGTEEDPTGGLSHGGRSEERTAD